MVSQTRPETNKDDGPGLTNKFRPPRRSIQILQTPPRENFWPTKILLPKKIPAIPSSAPKESHHLLLPLKKRPEAVPAASTAAADHSRQRQRIQQVRTLYRETLKILVQENKGKRTSELCSKAATILKSNGKFLNSAKLLGPVPGIEVGDEFHFRGEMRVVGLHCQCFSGIDYLEERDGTKLATSIVASGRYLNFMKSSNVLVYSGHGGNPQVGNGREKKDQKLERGNLALKNSMEARTPVRVILGFNRKDEQDETQGTVYVYDGLYFVQSARRERGEFGKLVFKFELVRNPDQPNVLPITAGGEKKKNMKKKAKKEEIVQKDISEGKEEVTVSVVNAWDGERPCPFTYVLNCCNGGLYYPIQFQFEVFRTSDSSGWGLRSRQYISSGSFICQYAGEYRVVKSKNGIRYHFDLGVSLGRNGFSIIDGTRLGNLSRFINRSDQPNLRADVDCRAARVLIYAAKDIPPRRELTLNSGY